MGKGAGRDVGRFPPARGQRLPKDCRKTAERRQKILKKLLKKNAVKNCQVPPQKSRPALLPPPGSAHHRPAVSVLSGIACFRPALSIAAWRRLYCSALSCTARGGWSGAVINLSAISFNADKKPSGRILRALAPANERNCQCESAEYRGNFRRLRNSECD